VKKLQKIEQFLIGFANAGFASSKTFAKMIFELAKPASAKPIKNSQNLNDCDSINNSKTRSIKELLQVPYEYI
jgi:hypothetical protein